MEIATVTDLIHVTVKALGLLINIPVDRTSGSKNSSGCMQNLPSRLWRVCVCKHWTVCEERLKQMLKLTKKTKQTRSQCKVNPVCLG